MDITSEDGITIALARDGAGVAEGFGPVVQVRKYNGSTAWFQVRRLDLFPSGLVLMSGYPYQPRKGTTSGVRYSSIPIRRTLQVRPR